MDGFARLGYTGILRSLDRKPHKPTSLMDVSRYQSSKNNKEPSLGDWICSMLVCDTMVLFYRLPGLGLYPSGVHMYSPLPGKRSQVICYSRIVSWTFNIFGFRMVSVSVSKKRQVFVQTGLWDLIRSRGQCLKSEWDLKRVQTHLMWWMLDVENLWYCMMALIERKHAQNCHPAWISITRELPATSAAFFTTHFG